MQESAPRKLHSPARPQFGTDADWRLTQLLAEIDNTGTLETVGEWIIDCETLEELIDRLNTNR